MSLQQQHQRGIEAAQVIENVAFQEAMKALKNEVMEQWKACPVRDREGQLLLLQLAKITDKFEGILLGLIESGKFAQRKLIDDNLRDENAAKRFARRII